MKSTTFSIQNSTQKSCDSSAARATGASGAAPAALSLLFDRQINAIPPLLPRSEIVAESWESDQPQRQIAVRRAVGALAIRHHFPVRADACRRVHRPQLRRGLERAGRVEVARPFDV